MVAQSSATLVSGLMPTGGWRYSFGVLTWRSGIAGRPRRITVGVNFRQLHYFRHLALVDAILTRRVGIAEDGSQGLPQISSIKWMVIMGESEGPTRLSVVKGQDFHAELQAYPGSGALWSWVPSIDGPQLVSETTHTQDESIGSGALQVFTFHAEAPGTHTLVFELKRPWESSSRRRKEITVEVA